MARSVDSLDADDWLYKGWNFETPVDGRDFETPVDGRDFETPVDGLDFETRMSKWDFETPARPRAARMEAQLASASRLAPARRALRDGKIDVARELLTLDILSHGEIADLLLLALTLADANRSITAVDLICDEFAPDRGLISDRDWLEIVDTALRKAAVFEFSEMYGDFMATAVESSEQPRIYEFLDQTRLAEYVDRVPDVGSYIRDIAARANLL